MVFRTHNTTCAMHVLVLRLGSIILKYSILPNFLSFVVIAFRFSPSSIEKLGFFFLPFCKMAMAGRMRSIIPQCNQLLKSESQTQTPALLRALLYPTTANSEVRVIDFPIFFFLFLVLHMGFDCSDVCLICGKMTG